MIDDALIILLCFSIFTILICILCVGIIVYRIFNIGKEFMDDYICNRYDK